MKKEKNVNEGLSALIEKLGYANAGRHDRGGKGEAQQGGP